MRTTSNIEVTVATGSTDEAVRLTRKALGHSQLYGHRVTVYELHHATRGWTGRIVMRCQALGCRWPQGKRNPYPKD